MGLRKKISFYLILVVFVYILVEILAFTAFSVFGKGEFSISNFDEIKSEIASIENYKIDRDIDDESIEEWYNNFVPHPYLGIIHNIQLYTSQKWLFTDLEKLKKDIDDKDTILVVLTGGSVAHELSFSSDIIEGYLKEVPEYSNKNIKFLSIATRSFKQPQQLYSIIYLQMLLGKIDLVINLDGFNEVGNEATQGYESRLHPLYPRVWAELLTTYSDTEDIIALAEQYNYTNWRKKAAIYFDGFDYSVSANVVWYFLDKYLQNEINIRAYKKKGHIGFFQRGPEYNNGKDQYILDSVNYWKISSDYIHKMSRAYGFKYFHFLQPNQYLPSSKPFSEVEKDLYVTLDVSKQSIPESYSLLIKSGDELKESGLKFFDLTRIFENTSDTIYRDNCCHVNNLGNEIMANEIGKTIKENF